MEITYTTTSYNYLHNYLRLPFSFILYSNNNYYIRTPIIFSTVISINLVYL